MALPSLPMFGVKLRRIANYQVNIIVSDLVLSLVARNPRLFSDVCQLGNLDRLYIPSLRSVSNVRLSRMWHLGSTKFTKVDAR